MCFFLFPLLCSKVSCGAKHTLVVTVDGCLFAWGDNRYGQCGLPWPSSQSTSSRGGGGGGGSSGDNMKHKNKDDNSIKKKLFGAGKLGTTSSVDSAADKGEGDGDGGGGGGSGMVVPHPSQVRLGDGARGEGVRYGPNKARPCI